MADKKDVVKPWEKLGISPSGIGQIPGFLDLAWAMEKKLTLCLVGETGIGKTPIVHQWCKAQDGYMEVLNFGHMSQEEISMSMFSDEGDTYDFLPARWMLRLNKEAEERGCAVLFMDEWNRGDKAMVNALFTLTDERRIHNFELHKNVLVVAAMNPSDGSYLVNEAEKDHAIRKRLNFVYCIEDLAAFVKFAKDDGWEPTVPAFVMALNSFLYDKGARDAGKAFACPSNWEKVSNIMKAARAKNLDLENNPAVSRMIEGQIGSVAADKYMAYVADQNTLIQPHEILKDYGPTAPVRKRVAGLLNCTIDSKTQKLAERADRAKSKASVISELNKGLAVVLFSEMPDPNKIAARLALYMNDIPNELLGAFAAQYLSEQTKLRGTDGDKYMNKLSSALAKHPAYKEKMGVIQAAVFEYKKSAKMLNAEDPLD